MNHTGAEPSLESLIERSAELKRALVDFACGPRLKQHLTRFMRKFVSPGEMLDEGDAANLVDRFALQHRLPTGKTVLDQFLASRPDLSPADREMVRGWRDPVEGIFEIRGKDRAAIVLLNLLDDLEYRTYSNMGPAAFRQLSKGGFLYARLVPVSPVPGAWLVSGYLTAYPKSSVAQMAQAALQLATAQPELVFRNPEKIEQGWQQMREDRAAFIEFFGSDELVLPPAEVNERLGAYYRHRQQATLAAQPKRRKPRRAPGPDVPAIEFPAEAADADTIGVIYDEIDGLNFYDEYGMLGELFADPALAADKRYADVLRGYLASDTIGPLPIRRVAAAHPAIADAVFRKVLHKPGFTWAEHGEALLRQRAHSAMKKTQRKVIPVLVRLVIIAAVGITTSCENSATTVSKPPVVSKPSAVVSKPSSAGQPSRVGQSAPGKLSREVRALLADGVGDTSKGYFQPESSSLVAAAAGNDNSKFYDLGKLLVRDGLGNTIIDLGREMNASWYEWSEQRAPSSEPDAYVRAWRQIVHAMRTVPGQHFRFLWTLYMDDTSVADSWPGSAYVDYIGTDIFDWYGGPDYTYPRTASGALDHEKKWQEILTTAVGGLDWIARFSRATGKPIIIPEWGLDFHAFGGQDDLLFIRNMMAWLKAHNAIGLYWGAHHVSPVPAASGPLLAHQGESAQDNTVGQVNAMGALLGGRLQYAGVYLPDSAELSDRTDQVVLAPWKNTGYQVILSVPMVPLPPAIKSYSGPPEPGNKPYQLADYPDAVAAIKHGLS